MQKPNNFKKYGCVGNVYLFNGPLVFAQKGNCFVCGEQENVYGLLSRDCFICRYHMEQIPSFNNIRKFRLQFGEIVSGGTGPAPRYYYHYQNIEPKEAYNKKKYYYFGDSIVFSSIYINGFYFRLNEHLYRIPVSLEIKIKKLEGPIKQSNYLFNCLICNKIKNGFIIDGKEICVNCIEKKKEIDDIKFKSDNENLYLTVKKEEFIIKKKYFQFYF